MAEELRPSSSNFETVGTSIKNTFTNASPMKMMMMMLIVIMLIPKLDITEIMLIMMLMMIY